MPTEDSSDNTRSQIRFDADAIVGHYRIVRRLGSGGMGEVYLAVDTELDRNVALKFMATVMATDPECRARFKREARAAAMLNHANVVIIHEVAEFQGRPYIAMEYVQGQTLRELIRQQGLPLARVLDITLQICGGLREAHAAGIIHHDIKPSNILVDLKGRCKLVDFGLAAIQGHDPLTRSGSTLGTIGYMSPEQVRGDVTDCRSDIFSLGALLYELVTGRRAFRGEYEAAVLYAIAHEDPEPLARHRADVPEALQEIVDQALKKDPSRRYQTVAELAADLARLAGAPGHRDARKDSGKVAAGPSIAVLPFGNLSADREQDYFCDGMAEEIINALSHVDGLHVAARTSAFSFKDQAVDVREIGRRLRVSTVLEGSVRKSGNHLRITAQLVDVDSGYHLWSERFDRDMEDVFAVQDEIALAIVRNLKVQLLSGERDKLTKRYTDDPVAYSLYLKGRYFWNRRYAGGLARGIDYFEQAIQRDALYAPAYVGVADCYNQFGYYGLMPAKEAYAKSKAAVAKALEIDDTLAEAHACIGWISTFYDWDWEAAERAFARALQLNPNCALAHNWYGLFLAIRGRFEDCVKEGARSLELEPVSLVFNAVWGLGYYWMRQFDKGIEHLKKTLEMDAGFSLTYLFLAFAYSGNRMWEEAVGALQRFIDLSAGSPFGLGHLGLVYGLSGRNQEAAQVLEQLDRLSEDRYVSPFYVALVHTGLGNKDQAFDYLHRAALERESWMTTLRYVPFMDSLRSDTRYQNLLKELGLLDQDDVDSTGGRISR